ncbi:VRR-NUC domain-containing protein [Hymenobacter psychrotolerans]|uniref:VRR-NUC domain-containing protein n=1 Tax=Hymenobacter psychrotolerans DSM 18569 TaxID=1121959 RepID=A0A1M7G6C6_9BACT|nr:VRR-NUC domain-containing protein [Hymenobacter psychrotolerans]SHM11811.1 VRR-NUC domain-containing protein [Hymenobacter psychrotolerans DSM 18569]
MKPQPQTPLELYDLKADEITAHILGYLSAKGVVAWAQDNRGRYNSKTGRWYPHPNNRVGVPDILGFRRLDAKFIGVEVKAGKDRLSDHQIEFLNELKACGGFPFVAYSYEQFVQSFERRGLHKISRCTRCEEWPDACQCPAPAAPATPDDTPAPPAPTCLPGHTVTNDPQAPYHHA